MKTPLLALMLLSSTAHAADVVNITVSGTLTRPPCVLSTGTTLTAAFGDVRTDQGDHRHCGSAGALEVLVGFFAKCQLHVQ